MYIRRWSEASGTSIEGWLRDSRRTQINDWRVLLCRRRRNRFLTAPLPVPGFLGRWSQYGRAADAICVFCRDQLHRCVGAALAVWVHRERADTFCCCGWTVLRWSWWSNPAAQQPIVIKAARRTTHGCKQKPDNVQQEAPAAAFMRTSKHVLCFCSGSRRYLDCLREVLARPLCRSQATLTASSPSCILRKFLFLD